MTRTDEQKRQAAIRKLRALRATAANAAASENEILIAAERAAELIAAWGITESEIQTGNPADWVTEIKIVPPTMKECYSVTQALPFIADACGVVVLTGFDYGTDIKARRCWFICGDTADAEYAAYLVDLVRGAAKRAWQFYLHYNRAAMRTRSVVERERRSFKAGFGRRVGRRLMEMAAPAAQPGGGGALVVLKQDAIKDHLKSDQRVNPDATYTPPRLNNVTGAVLQGERAADGVNLARPVTGGSDFPALGVTT